VHSNDVRRRLGENVWGCSLSGMYLASCGSRVVAREFRLMRSGYIVRGLFLRLVHFLFVELRRVAY